MKETKTRLLLPRGEWLGALLAAFRVANLELEQTRPKSLEYTFVTQSLPIIFSAVRSWEVWPTIRDGRDVCAGFTGTDIAREQLAQATWFVPLEELNSQAPKPNLFVGATPNITDRVARPTLSDMNGTRLYTSYPNTAQRFLNKNNLRAEIIYKQGAVEGFWRIDRGNGAILDIADTGKTGEDNEITPIVTVGPSERVVFVQSEMGDRDFLRVLELRGCLEKVAKRERK